jgi:protein LTV1
MQHLKEVGMQEDGVDSFMIEAPTTSSKGKGKAKDPIVLRDLPPEVLPSATELPRNYESQEAVPSSIAGFQPDMDPHLRQALEALEDDAFVDDGLEDDFFGELVEAGERGTEDDFDFDFDEAGVPDSDASAWSSSARTTESADDDDDAGWEARFAAFKRAQRTVAAPNDMSEDEHSEGGDTIGRLPEIAVIGGKRRRRGTSDASGYSMSSASLYRSEGLQTLDDRFDQVRKLVCSTLRMLY